MVLNQTTMDNKRLIEALCVIALDIFPTAKWIAQDGDGRWYAYNVKPTNESGFEWLETSEEGNIRFIIELAQPEDSEQQLYSIEKIINHVDQSRK